MNSVALIGRLTRDPEIRYTGDQMAIATFSIAIDRPPRRDGTRETDFPRITVFGRQAENCEKYLKKGRMVGVTGRIQTGSYTNKNGDKVYTTDIVADRVEFLEPGRLRQPGRLWPAGPGRLRQPGQLRTVRRILWRPEQLRPEPEFVWPAESGRLQPGRLRTGRLRPAVPGTFDAPGL